MRSSLGMFVLVVTLAGCERVDEDSTSMPISHVEREFVLAIVLDTSGSCRRMMERSGYQYFLKASENFFRDRMGKNDRILVCQLSADDDTVLTEAAPLGLRRRFGTAEALRQFIDENSDAGGTHAYRAMANTLEYLYELPGVSEGRTKVCVIVLSDLEDNSRTQDEDRQRMVEALHRFAETDNACIGLYWVSQTCLKDWRRLLTDAGIPFVIEADLVDDPPLPSFDQSM